MLCYDPLPCRKATYFILLILLPISTTTEYLLKTYCKVPRHITRTSYLTYQHPPGQNTARQPRQHPVVIFRHPRAVARALRCRFCFYFYILLAWFWLIQFFFFFFVVSICWWLHYYFNRKLLIVCILLASCMWFLFNIYTYMIESRALISFVWFHTKLDIFFYLKTNYA